MINLKQIVKTYIYMNVALILKIVKMIQYVFPISQQKSNKTHNRSTVGLAHTLKSFQYT